MWTGLKMRLLSCKIAATNFDIILSPHSEREMKYSICQSWSGCIRKKTSPNLLLLVVEDWALVSRVLLQQRVTELPFHPNSSVSTTCPQKFQCSCGGAQTIGQAFCFEETVDETEPATSIAELKSIQTPCNGCYSLWRSAHK